MPSALPVPDIRSALVERALPTITTWNRLEGRPRSQTFERALQAEVRDALWMLTKQWQMGEFRGSDAGSPVAAKLLMETTRLTKYRPGVGPTEEFPYDIGLQTKVERLKLRLRAGGDPASLDLRMAMGRYWQKLLSTLATDYRSEFATAYPINKPDPADATQAAFCAHLEVLQVFEAAAGRSMDGGA